MANLLDRIIYYLKDAVVHDGSGNVAISGNMEVGGTINGAQADRLLTRGSFSTTSFSTDAVTVAADTDSGEKTLTCTREGWYPYAIAGWNLTGRDRMHQNLYELYMTYRSSGTVTITYRFRNNANVSATIGLTVQILWIKIL